MRRKRKIFGVISILPRRSDAQLAIMSRREPQLVKKPPGFESPWGRQYPSRHFLIAS
jgi:hypothetical protein